MARKNMTGSVLTQNELQTKLVAKRLAECLKKGIIALDGDLGAGKTVFAKGFAQGLGITEEIISPTFTLVREYQGRVKFNHFDVYRIEDPEEMFEIGWEEYLEEEAITLIEWATLIGEILPPDILSIEITRLSNTQRKIQFSTENSQYEKAVTAAIDALIGEKL